MKPRTSGIKTNSLLRRVSTVKKPTSTLVNRPHPGPLQNNLSSAMIGQRQNDTKIGKDQLNALTKRLEASRPIEAQKAYATRDNAPYKNITPVEYFKKKIEKPEDLIIHKATPDDKNVIALKKNMTAITNSRVIEDQQLKQTYNPSNYEQNQKKFLYNNTIRYNVDYNQPGYINMKKDDINYYKQQQIEMDKDRQSVDNIIEDMVKIDIFGNQKN